MTVKISRQFIQLISQFVKNALKGGRGREMINPTLAVNKVTFVVTRGFPDSLGSNGS